MSDKKAVREHFYPRIELVQKSFILRVAEALTTGAEKYGDYNWQGFNREQQEDILRHALVHIHDHMNGDRSEDNLANAACNIMFAMWFQENTPGPSLQRSADAPAQISEAKEQIKKPLSVYLARPIDAADVHRVMNHAISDASAKSEELIFALQKAGCCVYNPLSAFGNSVGFDEGFVNKTNKAAIKECDAVVAVLFKGMTSYGVPLDVEFAKSVGKKVVVWTDVDFVLMRHPNLFSSPDLDKVISELLKGSEDLAEF